MVELVVSAMMGSPTSEKAVLHGSGGVSAPARKPQIWLRWLHAGVVVVGLGLCLASATAVPPAAPGRWVLLLVGAQLLLSGLYTLFTLGLRTECAHMLFGLLLVISPWAFGYADAGRPALLSWGLGGLTVVLAAAALPAAGRVAIESRAVEDHGRSGTRWVGELVAVEDQPTGRHHWPESEVDQASRDDVTASEARGPDHGPGAVTSAGPQGTASSSRSVIPHRLPSLPRGGGVRSGAGGRTKAQLYADARDHGIQGRSTMTKAELEAHLGRR